MSDKAFIDTNVLIHLFDGRTPTKQRRAGELLRELAEKDDAPVVSTQVLQEAFVALTRKLGMDPKDALATLQMMKDASFTVHVVDVPLIWRAATRSISARISFWDSLIVEAAIDAGCAVLYTEDMQADRSFERLAVVNPFA